MAGAVRRHRARGRHARSAGTPADSARKRAAGAIRRRAVPGGAAGRHRLRRPQSRTGAHARTGRDRAGGAGTRNPPMGRDRIICAGAGGAAHGTGIRAQGDCHHRHQRQDHGDQPGRLVVPALRLEDQGSRQHQPGCAGCVARRARYRRFAASLGAGTFQLSIACDVQLAGGRCHGVERHARPSRLAWRHGGLCRRQGAHLRYAYGAGLEPRRPGNDAHGVAAGDPDQLRQGRAGIGELLRPGFRARHALVERRGGSGRGREEAPQQERRGRIAAGVDQSLDAGRRFEDSRPAQCDECAGGAGLVPRDRFAAGAAVARLARLSRRAAPGRTGDHHRRRRLL